MAKSTKVVTPKNDTEYYISIGENLNAEDYTCAYPTGMEELKDCVTELLDESYGEVNPEDIKIYQLTNLKVKSNRTVSIEEEK